MSTLPLAQATAALRDAQIALDKHLSDWSQHSEEEMAAVARRWWLARRDFQAAILEPDESVAS